MATRPNINVSVGSLPSSRGWGPGWPNCQEARWVPLNVPGLNVSFGWVHERVAELARRLIQECAMRGYRFKDGQCWGANCRPVRGSTTPSNHSWALALDFNSAFNWLGRSDGGDIPRWMVELWNEHGWRWGGSYSGRKDPMHFEFMGTPEQATAMTLWAREQQLGEDRMTDAEKKQLKQALDLAQAATERLEGMERRVRGQAQPPNPGPRRQGWVWADKFLSEPSK